MRRTSTTISLKPTLLIAILFLSCVTRVNSQTSTMTFKHFSVSEGLSQSTVFSILQDSQGFLWFGTRTGGLNKYDGYSFKHYKKDRDDPGSISGNEVLTIFEDSQGVMWVGTRGDGLNKFNRQNEKFTRYYHDESDPNSLISNSVNGIFEDASGKLWIATNNGLCIYNRKTDDFREVINNLEDLTFSTVQYITETADGLICIGMKNNGLFVIDGKKEEVLHHFIPDKDNPFSISSNDITSLLIDQQNRLWIGTKNAGLNRLDNLDDVNFIHFREDPLDNNSLSSNIIRTLHQDEEGTIWIGTKNGLDQLLPEEQNSFNPSFIHHQANDNDDHSLSNNSIYSFLEDSQGNFWMGTWSGGVNYLDFGAQKFEHFKYQLDESAGLSSNTVSSFAINNAGIWIGTEGGGLNLLDPNRKMFTHIRHDVNDTLSLKSDHVKALHFDSMGRLWIGSYDGLHRYDWQNNSFTNFLAGQTVYTIEAGDENNLWIGTSNALLRMNTIDFSLKTYVDDNEDPNSISNSRINKVFKDNDKNIWIATKSGLNLYLPEKDHFKSYLYSRDDPNSISHDNITSICQDKSGNIWIGTIDGLNRYNPEIDGFEFIGEKNGLPDNSISNLIADHEGNIWITSNRGLTEFNPNIKTEDEQSRSKSIRNFDINDGLQGNEFTSNASLVSNTGEIFLGGSNGFNVFHPENIKANLLKPKVVITQFKLFNKEIGIGTKDSPLDRHISYTKSITLSHKQSVFSFSFVALNFTSPEKNQYAYMMEGFDNDWNYVGTRREASYTNLPPGEYSFRVKASNNDGIWNESGTSIQIKVRAPWYKTIVFYVSVALLLALAVYLFIKAREKQARADKERLEKELSKGKEEIRQKGLMVEKQKNDLIAKEESEKELKWHNTGLIKLTNIVSESRQDINLLTNSLIYEIVQYLEAHMGAIYITNDDHLELKGSYAPDTKRIDSARIEVGEGLVGSCFKDKKTIKIDNLPDNYASLGSGLGNTKLSHLVLIPILYNDSVEGVIEIISNTEITEAKINLINSLCSTLGATMANERSSSKIQNMLRMANEQTEQLSSQEEELRQNLEELAATQEESSRREKELMQEIASLKKKLKSS